MLALMKHLKDTDAANAWETYKEFNFPRAMEKIKKFGTSSGLNETFEEFIVCNHCGDNGEKLSKEDVVKKYFTLPEDNDG